ncbi:MAG: nucleotidyltransferase domain-containing protein [Firmicutes bacterium]|nr:nucleotidyltransferase domain-containing protein [Bacillota bacterium]
MSTSRKGGFTGERDTVSGDDMGVLDPDGRRHLVPPDERRRILDRVRAVLESDPDVIFAYAHGSCLEGRPCRDLDIAVYYRDGMEARDQLDASLDLGARLARVAGMPVDVHSLNLAPVEFRYHATRGVLLFAREREASFDFRERTWAQYFDLEPFLRDSLNDLLP